MELLSNVHESNLVEYAAREPKAIVVSGDLTIATECRGFRDAYPDRFFSLGMAEQNMLSWAGGMAREGFVPFVHTFSVFLYRRPLDQLEMSICYPNLPVRLVGFLPGLDTPGGVTHQAIDDISVLRGLPNLSIIEVGDATDIESVLDVTTDIAGPVYLRMLRGEVPRLFPADQPLAFNQARVISEGSDVTLITTGKMTEEALRATAAISAAGVSLHHVHVSTLKPFTDPIVLDAVSRPRHGVITLENHLRIGGVGTAVAEMMADNGVGKRLLRMGIDNAYSQGSTFEYLLRKHGLDALSLVRQIEQMTGASLGLDEGDLGATRTEDVAARSTEQLEAL